MNELKEPVEFPIRETPLPVKKRRTQFVLKLLLGLVALGLVFYFVDLREFGTILLGMNLWFVLIAVVLFYLDRGLMAYKWGLLLHRFDIHIPLLTLVRIYLTAFIAGIFLPITIGADLFRLYSLSRHRINAKPVLASIFIERFIGVITVVILAAFSLGLAFILLRDRWDHISGLVWYLITAAVVGAIIIGTFLAIAQRGGKILGLMSRLPLVGALRQTFILAYEFKQHRRTLAVVSSWTFIENFFPVVATFLLVRALHIEVSFLELLAIIPLIVLAIRIPISFEGLGIQEGLYIGLLGLVGVPAVEALILSTVTRGVYLLCALPWGIHYLAFGHRKIESGQQAVSTA